MEQPPRLTPQSVAEQVEELGYAVVLEGTHDKLAVKVTGENGASKVIVMDFSETAGTEKGQED